MWRVPPRCDGPPDDREYLQYNLRTYQLARWRVAFASTRNIVYVGLGDDDFELFKSSWRLVPLCLRCHGRGMDAAHWAGRCAAFTRWRVYWPTITGAVFLHLAGIFLAEH